LVLDPGFTPSLEIQPSLTPRQFITLAAELIDAELN
jgi:hypothetical protein